MTKHSAKDKKNNVAQTPHMDIVLRPLEKVIHDSMMPYSEFVIMDRALPRVEDGLKPVQRRVLYSMLEVGVTPDKPYRKSARIVGDCMGKYHPHGDRSIYDTMVRMAQDFNMGEVLVDGHGNFGSVDGDGAAAMRYTEARLSPISLELLKDIEKDTVTWSFNFDDTTKEPDMLPGRFPNLLVNGATGIAVGLATNIPTHNLGEAIDAVVAYIDNKKITLPEIMKVMPAPDFSTGGYILNTSEVEQIYQTGKGKIILRAKHHIEDVDGGKQNIVFTQIPYQVNKSVLLQKIAKLKSENKEPIYSFISDIVDESDRDGTRAVIKLKKDTNIAVLLDRLYKQTDLQVNFNANMVAIAGGKPKQMGLIEIISYYVEYQKQIVYRRTKFDLEVSEKRAHILEGLLIAIKNIDEVIAIIKASKSVNEAKTTLMSTFYLTDVQAQAILDMRLARLTNLEVNRLITELNALHELIEKLKRILNSDKLQFNLIKNEMLEIKNKYASPRKSVMVDDGELEDLSGITSEVQALPTIVEEEVIITYSAGDTIKVVGLKNYKLSQKDFSANASSHDIPTINLKTLNTRKVYLFTNHGNCHILQVNDIPQVKFKEKGVLLSRLVKNYELGEVVVAILDLDDMVEADVLMVTRRGLLKISKASEYLLSKQTFAAIKLDEGDEVICCAVNKTDVNLAVITKEGLALQFDKSDVASIGRMARGVKAVSLNDGDFVAGSFMLPENAGVAIFMKNGNAKVIKAAEVVVAGRGRKGTRVLSLADKANEIVKAFVLDKNISYVTKSTNQEYTFVLNKKMALEDKDGRGKNVLTTKRKTNECVEVSAYEILEL